MLRNKNAVVYGAGGAIGGAVARAFAHEGARVFLAGRTGAKMEAVASDILAAGASATVAEVDALSEAAIERHLDAVMHEVGTIDISLNAVGFEEAQGIPLTELPLEDFLFPSMAWSKTVFLTSRAAARRMVTAGSGVIFTVNAPLGNEGLGGGFPSACAAISTITRTLAGEIGPNGVRVLCPAAERDPRIRVVATIRRPVRGRTRRRCGCGTGRDGSGHALAPITNARGIRGGRCVHGIGSCQCNDWNRRQSQLRITGRLTR
jgi:3-oxoacyl-[acyl-carrier protein] reductase